MPENEKLKLLRLQSLVNRIDEIPVISPLASKLINLDLDADNADFLLNRLIESDPGLMAKLAGLAMSPLVNPTGSPRHTAREITRTLGLHQVYALAVSVAVAGTFKGVKYLEHWKHAITVAYGTREACRMTRSPIPSGTAYLAGLIHDIGVSVLEYLQADLDPNDPSRVDPSDRDHHPLVGGLLAKRWQLDFALTEVIQLHHSVALEHPSSLVKMVRLVDEHVIRLEDKQQVNSNGEAQEAVPEEECPLQAHLGMSADLVTELKSRIAGQSDWISQIAQVMIKG